MTICLMEVVVGSLRCSIIGIHCHLECSLYVVVFFFFKQKTAYDMRISDWSSDVCSSDLNYRTQVLPAASRVALCDHRWTGLAGDAGEAFRSSAQDGVAPFPIGWRGCGAGLAVRGR